MSNFDLRKYLAEGKLNEAMSPQDVVDIADTVAEEFTIESAEEGDFMVYSVGEMDVDNMFFELDTDVTSQTPERILKMSNLGVGEGWGGSFRINPKEEGYEVRNSEKGGLVAIIDGMGNFKMISADESRAEMGRAKGEETDYMQRRKEMSDYMNEAYTPGSGWTKDFDYDGMLSLALKLNADSPMDLLLKVSSDLEDVNYHRENSHLTDAIDAIKAGDRVEAKIAINRFRKEIKTTLNEGIFDRAKAKIKGAATGIKTAVGNVAAAVKGNKDAIKDTALEVGMTKLKVKATTLNKDLDKVISDIDKLFPEKKLEKNPKLANIIDQYKISLENAKTQNAKIGKIEMKESEITETPLNKTKMKKSELKEMIKAAMMAEGSNYYEDILKEDMSIEDVYNDAKRQVKDIYNIDVPMDVVKQWADNYQFPYSREEDPNDEDNYILVYDFGTEERGDFMEWLKDNGLREDARTDAEQEGYKDGFEDAKDDIEAKLKDMKVSEAEEVDVEDNEKVDVDIEKDVEVDDKSVETDIEVKGSMPGEDADEIAVQSLLMKAQEEAEKLGDEKLTDQIGNTITYFTRAHVATVDEAEEMDEIAALPGSTGVEDVNVDDPAEDAMVGLTERLRWQRIAGIAKDNGLYDNLK